MFLKNNYYTTLQVILNGDLSQADNIMSFINKLPIKLFNKLSFVKDEVNKEYINLNNRRLRDWEDVDDKHYVFEINSDLGLKFEEFKDDELLESIHLNPFKICSSFENSELGSYQKGEEEIKYVLFKRQGKYVVERNSSKIVLTNINLNAINEIGNMSATRSKSLKK